MSRLAAQSLPVCSVFKEVPLNADKDVGYHTVQFSAKGGSASGGDGGNLASGMYFYRLTAQSYVDTKKLVLVR